MLWFVCYFPELDFCSCFLFWSSDDAEGRQQKDTGDEGASIPEVPPMSMALRLRALMMLTVMVLAVGL